jgi:hypothetical protein
MDLINALDWVNFVLTLKCLIFKTPYMLINFLRALAATVSVCIPHIIFIKNYTEIFHVVY